MNCRILLVGAGRRYSFVQRLQKAGIHVSSYELDTQPPISEICSIIPACKDWVAARNHIQALSEHYKYDAILPLNDQATFELAGEPLVIGHDKVVAGICYDKREFKNFMLLHFPDLYPKASFGDDVIVKPRFGASSKGIRFNHWKYESWAEYDDLTEVMQRKVEGDEYSVDVYFTKRGVCMGAIPRTRERVAGGEVIDSRTVDNSLLSDITCQIGKRLSMTGPACFQYILEKGTDKPYLFEINGRFGGGNILSLEAGFDMIDMMKREYFFNEDLEEKQFRYITQVKRGLFMRRVNREVFFHGVL